MQDPTKGAPVEEPEAAAPQGSQATEATTPTPAEPPQQVAEEKTVAPGPEKVPGVREFDLDAVAEDEDGQLVWNPTPGVIYKGKTPKELFDNIAKGITEKDSYIQKLKTEKVVKVPDRYKRPTGPVPQKDEVGDPPDRDAILRKYLDQVTREEGVAPEMLRWTNQDWKRYKSESELEDWELVQKIQGVQHCRERVQRLAGEEYVAQTQVWANNRTISEDTQNVEKLLSGFAVDPEQFDFEAVLDRVMEDPNNFEDGLLKSGSVVREAATELSRLKARQTESKIRQKLEDDIARGREAKRQVKTPPTTSASYKPTTKPARSFDEAYINAVREFRARSGRE